jgi:hypothetical protein
VGDRPAAHQVVDALALAREVRGGVIDAHPGLGDDDRGAQPRRRPLHEQVDDASRQRDRDVIHRPPTARANALSGDLPFADLFAPRPESPDTDTRPNDESPAKTGLLGDGESRTRTGDTTIFSRVLYQLS